MNLPELPDGYRWIMAEEILQKGDMFRSNTKISWKESDLMGEYAHRNFQYIRKVSPQPDDKKP